MKKRLYALKDNVWVNLAVMWGLIVLVGVYVVVGEETFAKHYLLNWIYRMGWGVMGLFVVIRVVKH